MFQPRPPSRSPGVREPAQERAAQGDDYFNAEGTEDGSDETTSLRGRDLHIQIPDPHVQANMAITALQYLPMPVIVLSSMKTVVLANEAMGRLLGIDATAGEEDEEVTDDDSAAMKGTYYAQGATDTLEGLTLGQLGIDLLRGGNAVFVAWDDILENVVDDASKAQSATTQLNTHHRPAPYGDPADATPRALPRRTTSISSRRSKARGDKTEVHDAVVDVIFSTRRDPETGLPILAKADAKSKIGDHMQVKMIISVWATETDQYFTLTFTAASNATSASRPGPGTHGTSSATGSAAGSNQGNDFPRTTSRTVAKPSTNHSASLASGLSSNSSASSAKRSGGQSSGSAPTSQITSPSAGPLRQFPPQGPPAKTSSAAAPTIFAKSMKLKDAILNSMAMPAYAMWKDESFGVPNIAAIRMLYPYIEDADLDSTEDARDFLSRYVIYRENFTEQLPLDDLPIYRLMREQKPFERYRVGMYSAKDGSRILYDVSGQCLLDEKGEFLGGLVIFNDVTGFQKTINQEKERNERQFEEITNMIPQMIWRTTPNGEHDYYSDRWYEYTGLTHEQSSGLGWLNAFHPDDLEIAKPRWAHSLATGDEYLTEYRCKSAAGEWRWMLGRAAPMRDDDGKIIKWFGTCTDIHDVVIAREEARQTRAQLERVIQHSRITLWAMDKNYKLHILEGQAMYTPEVPDSVRPRKMQQYIGMSILDILKEQNRKSELNIYPNAVRKILSGELQDVTVEVQVGDTGRHFRVRLFPLLRHERAGGIEGQSFIDGVVGVSLEITEQKKAEAEIQRRDRENARLMAQSVAAKEASKMKSQFLANMSHEIRTPIAGVIGMSELLLDDDSGELSTEQRECAENIQRSANGLLTVINDILDFSKVESGRLDIEEVQFDLSVVVHDINKMLSFAAERKGLKYIADIQELRSWKVMGDPGRLRQVITNLLTNSIKFTSEGSVTMRVKVRKETEESLEVEFIVEDTGIGIEEEVRRKLFKPFSQADSSTARRFGGTGLGLTISKNLVELMHGSIDLKSKLGRGTEASFWIPFHKAPYQTGEADAPLLDIGLIPDRLQSEVSVSRLPSEHSGKGQPPTPPVRTPHIRAPSTQGMLGLSGILDEGLPELSEAERKKVQVLVVEDNPINQQIALKTIKKLGFPVNAVWNGKEALNYLEAPSADRPRPDIILMDVQMPIMDGYRATWSLRNTAPFADNLEMKGTPIVAMTASAIQGDREKCQNAGMDDYLSKPVKKPNLERMLVKWAIEGKRKRAELRANGEATKRPVGVRNGSSSFEGSVQSHDSATEHLTSELDKLEFTCRSAMERSSETVEESSQRRQQAEEKAIHLRDDALINSGEDPRSKLGRGLSSDGTEKPKKDGTRDEHSLTVANMRKLAANGAEGQQKSSGVRRLMEEGGGGGGPSSSLAATDSSAGGENRAVGSRNPSPFAQRKAKP